MAGTEAPDGTDDQIRHLMAYAAETGNTALVMTCQAALGYGAASPQVRESARKECARIIWAAATVDPVPPGLWDLR